MTSTNDGFVIYKNKLRGEISFEGSVDIGSLDIEDTMEVSFDINGLISTDGTHYYSPQTHTIRYIISSSVISSGSVIDTFTHEIDSRTQYFSKKIMFS